MTKTSSSMAHVLVALEVASGRMRRPNRCSVCGRKGKVDGHHNDYAKPLEVIWVCRSCHQKIHRGSLKVIGVKIPPRDSFDYFVRLWPKNKERLDAILKQVPIIGSVNKLANTVLAFSLHNYENNVKWVTQEPKGKP